MSLNIDIDWTDDAVLSTIIYTAISVVVNVIVCCLAGRDLRIRLKEKARVEAEARKIEEENGMIVRKKSTKDELVVVQDDLMDDVSDGESVSIGQNIPTNNDPPNNEQQQQQLQVTTLKGGNISSQSYSDDNQEQQELVVASLITEETLKMKQIQNVTQGTATPSIQEQGKTETQTQTQTQAAMQIALHSNRKASSQKQLNIPNNGDSGGGGGGGGGDSIKPSILPQKSVESTASRGSFDTSHEHTPNGNDTENENENELEHENENENVFNNARMPSIPSFDAAKSIAVQHKPQTKGTTQMVVALPRTLSITDELLAGPDANKNGSRNNSRPSSARAAQTVRNNQVSIATTDGNSGTNFVPLKRHNMTTVDQHHKTSLGMEDDLGDGQHPWDRLPSLHHNASQSHSRATTTIHSQIFAQNLQENHGKRKDPDLETWQRQFCWFYLGVIRRWSVYSPLLLHTWDTATDIGVIIGWIKQANVSRDVIFSFTNEQQLTTTFWYAVVSISVMIMYRIVSAIAIRKSLGWKSSFLQLLDLLLYREVYEAYMDERMKPTVHLRFIRRMEATFESAPQALLQMVFVLKDTDSQVSTLIYLSVLLSVYSVASSVIRDDDWKFGGRRSPWNKKCWPHRKFLLRSFFRLFEIAGRLATFAVFWYCVGGFWTIVILFFEIAFYTCIFKLNMLGNDFSNVVGIIVAHPNLSYRYYYMPLRHKHGKFTPRDSNSRIQAAIKSKDSVTAHTLDRLRNSLHENPTGSRQNSTRSINHEANQDYFENETVNSAMLRVHSKLYKFTLFMGWFTLWTPICHFLSRYRPVNTITLFYLSRSALNILLLLFALAWYFFRVTTQFGERFATRSFAFAFVCVILVLVLYFWQIAKAMKRIEAMNLDIFGVIHAAKEDIDLFRRFFKRAADKVHEQRGSDGRTPLMECAIHADMRVLDMLLEAKPNPFLRDAEGWSVIYYVIANRQILSQHEMRREYMDYMKRESFILQVLEYASKNAFFLEMNHDHHRKTSSHHRRRSDRNSQSPRFSRGGSKDGSFDFGFRSGSKSKRSINLLPRQRSRSSGNKSDNNTSDKNNNNNNSSNNNSNGNINVDVNVHHERQVTPNNLDRQRSRSSQIAGKSSKKSERSANHIAQLVRLNTNTAEQHTQSPPAKPNMDGFGASSLSSGDIEIVDDGAITPAPLSDNESNVIIPKFHETQSSTIVHDLDTNKLEKPSQQAKGKNGGLLLLQNSSTINESVNSDVENEDANVGTLVVKSDAMLVVSETEFDSGGDSKEDDDDGDDEDENENEDEDQNNDANNDDDNNNDNENNGNRDETDKEIENKMDTFAKAVWDATTDNEADNEKKPDVNDARKASRDLVLSRSVSTGGNSSYTDIINTPSTMHPQITRRILINMKSQEFARTVLHVAVFQNDRSMVEFLLSMGADPNSKDSKRGETPVHAAARYGHSLVMEVFLGWETERQRLIAENDNMNEISINMTAGARATGTIDENSTNVNITRPHGPSTSRSQTNGYNSGTNTDINNGGTTPNGNGNGNGDGNGNNTTVVLFPKVDFSIEMDWGHDVLFWAAVCDQLDIVEELLNRGFTIDYLDSSNENVLSKIIRKGKKFSTVAEWILEDKLLPKNILLAKNSQNKTTLEEAVSKKKLHLIKMLVEQTDDHSTIINAFLLAIRNRKDSIQCSIATEIVETAVKDISTHRGQNGDTTLMWVCKMGIEDLVDKICQLCPELIEVKDKKGDTALFYAARKNKEEHVKCIRLLVSKYKADILWKNNNGQTILEICEKYANLAAKDFLRQRIKRKTLKSRANSDLDKNTTNRTSLDEVKVISNQTD